MSEANWLHELVGLRNNLLNTHMDTELLKRIRALAANDEGISAEGTRRLLAAYDELVRQAQLQDAANDLNREDLEELQTRMAAAEERSDRWQERAEAIAQERGELFRAGEKMRADLEPHRAGPSRATRQSVREWDEAAQPIRDMVSILSNKD